MSLLIGLSNFDSALGGFIVGVILLALILVFTEPPSPKIY